MLYYLLYQHSQLVNVIRYPSFRAIAAGAERLLSYRDEAVRRAAAWMVEFDGVAAGRWAEFVMP